MQKPIVIENLVTSLDCWSVECSLWERGSHPYVLKLSNAPPSRAILFTGLRRCRFSGRGRFRGRFCGYSGAFLQLIVRIDPAFEERAVSNAPAAVSSERGSALRARSPKRVSRRDLPRETLRRFSIRSFPPLPHAPRDPN